METMDETPYVEEPVHFKLGESIIEAELHKGRRDEDVRWLSVDEVVRIHDEMIQTFGGATGMLDLGKVESALDRARHSRVYAEDLFPTILHKAASMMHDVLVYHPFADGQKRTGLSSAFIFLGLNGYSLWSRNVSDEVHFAIEVAKGQHDVEEVTRWLADRIAPPSALGENEIERLLKMVRPHERQCHRCQRYLRIRAYRTTCTGCGAEYKVLIRCGAVKESAPGKKEFKATIGLSRIGAWSSTGPSFAGASLKPSLRWGALQVNKVSGPPVATILIGDPAPPLPRERYVTAVTVLNDGPTPLRATKAWVHLSERWLQLPWTIPNSDGSRQAKDLNPGDEESFEVCAFQIWDRSVVLPTEHGWPENPRRLEVAPADIRLKVTTMEGATLGPRAASISLEVGTADPATPLVTWREP